MSSYRLNLTIDDEFATVLQSLKSSSPLASDVSIIRDAVGAKYIAHRNAQRKAWADSIPVLELTDKQMEQLQKNIEESKASGFTKRYIDSRELINEAIKIEG
jgi:hypothetical protein